MNEFKEALETMCKRCSNHEMCNGTGCSPKKKLHELVEKATPKKPEEKMLIRKDNYRDGTNIPRYVWWCPNCHLEHISTDVFNYCPTCGQALDWSNGNE